MAVIEHSVTVDCGLAVVWDIWSDVRRLPQLSKSTIEVRDAPERLTAVGQTFCQIAGAAGRGAAVRWRVVDIEARDHLVIEGSPGYGVHVTITEAVAAVGPQRTRLTLTTDYRLPFGPLGRMVSKLGLDRLADREAREVIEGVAALCRAAAQDEARDPAQA